MASNPTGAPHAAMIEQLIEEARSAEWSDEPDMVTRLRQAAKLLESVDLYRAGLLYEGALVSYQGHIYRAVSVEKMEKGAPQARLWRVAIDTGAPNVPQMIDVNELRILHEAPQPQHSYVDDYHV